MERKFTSYYYALTVDGRIGAIVGLPCNCVICEEEDHPEYKAFLKWVEEGNVPPEIYY